MIRQTQTAVYWETAFEIEEADLEYLYNLLLEDETPLSTDEMALAIICRRCEHETQALERREQGMVVYRPEESYAVSQQVVFPVLQYRAGRVVSVRRGYNPDQGEFEVIAVDFGNGQPPREFAAKLADHKLNHSPLAPGEADLRSPEALFAEYGLAIAARLEAHLQTRPEVVRIAGRLFLRSLLVNVSIGHLNIAEAALDMMGGGPLSTETLLREIGLADKVNPRLQAFSLNYALQEDGRFDDVGPNNEILWFLHRLEPPEVVSTPRRLENAVAVYDRSRLTAGLLALERELEDEFMPAPPPSPRTEEIEITLTFPHWRVGTLPLTARLKPLFPAAHKPRVRFTLVDGDSGDKFAGWIVQSGRYVFGLEEWYQRLEVPVGGLVILRRGDHPGEVVVRAVKRRPTREWVRTVTASADGRLIFTMQKRLMAVAYDDLMVAAVDNPIAVDEVWLKSQTMPLDLLVADVFRELAKLNPQSAVHAKTLYAVVNVARRCPPGAVFAELVTRPYYVHVGDAYWRFDQTQWRSRA